MDVRIEKAVSPREVKEFIDIPHELYRNDPNYVPELFIAQQKLFDKKKNPFFRHAETALFVARKNGNVAGRVAVIRNGNYQQFTGEKDGFFGFFDVQNDGEVADGLLSAVKEKAREWQCSGLIGPVNFSTNDTCGLLIDGFQSPPVIMMTYQPAYHQQHLEKFGFTRKMDLLAYRLIPRIGDDKTLRIHRLLEERLKQRGITIRNMNLRDFKNEVNRIREVYNAAWEKNWGFVPMTPEEFDFAAADMKSIVDPDFAYIAEKNGKAIGFSLTIPNLNEVFIRIPRGRLFPTGLFKLLYYKNKVKSVRVLTLGVTEPYRKSGIDVCFYARNIETARRKNIEWAEASWILENNEMMNRALVNLGGEAYKKYRLYELPL